MEYKPFEPFKALNPGEKVKIRDNGPIYEVVALHEKYFFGKNESTWTWDIVYEIIDTEKGTTHYSTSGYLWTLSDSKEVEGWSSEKWNAWLETADDYIRCK